MHWRTHFCCLSNNWANSAASGGALQHWKKVNTTDLIKNASFQIVPIPNDTNEIQTVRNENATCLGASDSNASNCSLVS